MATLTASSCQTGSGGGFLSPAKYIENGVVCRSAVYSFGAAQSAGDVIRMVPVPAGAQVIDVITAFTLGGAAFTANVGDGNATGRYNTSVSSNVASVIHATASGGIGYSYSAEDTIDIVIGTATSASAAGSVRLTVLYSMDQASDGSS